MTRQTSANTWDLVRNNWQFIIVAAAFIYGYATLRATVGEIQRTVARNRQEVSKDIDHAKIEAEKARQASAKVVEVKFTAIQSQLAEIKAALRRMEPKQ